MSGTLIEKKIINTRISNKKLKVLDIGCGPANVLNYLPKCDYYGYDIDKRSINYAKKNIIRKIFIFFAKNLIKMNLKSYQILILFCYLEFFII